jgi:hypothetical protein
MGENSGPPPAPPAYASQLQHVDQALFDQLAAQQLTGQTPQNYAHYNSLAQQQHYAQNAIQQAAANRSPSPFASFRPLEIKMQRKVARLVAQIPMRLAARIVSIDCYETGTNNLSIVVLFDNRQQIIFANIDEFPTDEDIARIALECPP